LTGPAAGEPYRPTETQARSTRTRDGASAILTVLALGLAFRLIIAHQLPGSGFQVDLVAFRFWAADLAREGLAGFYNRPFFHDYTPGYLYILWLVGIVGQAAGNIGDLIKIPAILADVALGWLAWSMTLELGASRRAALVAGALVIANPVTWFDSVVWGQVDSVGVVFLLVGLRELWRDRPERSAILAVLAALTKPQLGILIPIVAVVVVRRALWPRGGFGDDDPPWSEPSTFTTERRALRWIRIPTTAIAGLLTAIALSIPFGLSLPGLVTQVFKTAGGYPYLSLNAYNPWALLSMNGTGIASNSGWVCDVVVHPGGPLAIGPFTIVAPTTSSCEPAFLFFGVIPAVTVGALLFLAAAVAVLVVVARRPDRLTMLVGVTALAIAFFILPTRVHERYLFPLVALGAILAAVSWRWRLAYVLSSAATLANMYVVLTVLYPNNPNVQDWFHIGPAIRSTTGVWVVALTQLGVFLWAATELRGAARRRLGDEVGGLPTPAARVQPAEPASADGSDTSEWVELA
jgi:dolichyl-phosphate-mannose-protein mannosyltransferase